MELCSWHVCIGTVTGSKLLHEKLDRFSEARHYSLASKFRSEIFSLQFTQYVRRRKSLVELHTVTQIAVSSGAIGSGQWSRPACRCCIFMTIVCGCSLSYKRQFPAIFQREFSGRSLLLLLNFPKNFAWKFPVFSNRVVKTTRFLKLVNCEEKTG